MTFHPKAWRKATGATGVMMLARELEETNDRLQRGKNPSINGVKWVDNFTRTHEGFTGPNYTFQ